VMLALFFIIKACVGCLFNDANIIPSLTNSLFTNSICPVYLWLLIFLLFFESITPLARGILQ